MTIYLLMMLMGGSLQHQVYEDPAKACVAMSESKVKHKTIYALGFQKNCQTMVANNNSRVCVATPPIFALQKMKCSFNKKDKKWTLALDEGKKSDAKKKK